MVFRVSLRILRRQHLQGGEDIHKCILYTLTFFPSFFFISVSLLPPLFITINSIINYSNKPSSAVMLRGSVPLKPGYVSTGYDDTSSLTALVRIKDPRKVPKPEWHAPWKLMRVSVCRIICLFWRYTLLLILYLCF